MYTVVFVTASNKKEAEKIAKGLLAGRLIACCNIVDKIKSIYRWQGKVETSDEVLMIMKTKKAAVSKVIAKVKSLHSYSVPEVIALPISKGSRAYLSWIAENVK